MKLAILVGAMASVVGFLPVRADDLDAKVTVDETIQSVLGILGDKETASDERRERIMSVIKPVFDFELMAKLTVGKRQWTRFSESQREEFVDLFIQKLRRAYLDKLELFSDETVVVGDSVAARSGKVHVPTHVISKGDRISILYKLYHPKGASWRVYDMEILDVSVVSSYRSEYIPILRAGEPETLFAKMRESISAGSGGE
ncbi:MAG: ABC transporter substrate-binding protein [Lentisphaerae bacterium]|jgi:phospholipid transport system substrate-binding protein|nr:ABC transporter substrate-binding protein [Lentisphaerota bacterium]MBT4814356.1 ABC transporter substrate-binding protein [Lentisphaerota bacterium]MBT5609274.1 ABC transporter substrate-binding protein [Lentisphaerota bacterium]MBT7059432.1 ABC transporter substrate-binding protein [Lentisphaerota bacterium]MBT7847816.1 ABC transporter substrate-binding protein [Lentisphaerota bacterium]